MVSDNDDGVPMRSRLLTFIAMVFGMICTALPARADYFVWQDPATGLSLSWPDTWKMVSNADPDDIVTIMAPSGRAHAACRVRARHDGRYAIYPGKYSWAVQREAYSRDFWDRYLAEYTDHKVFQSYDGAGLGRGFAGYALGGYESAVQGPEMARRALMFASLYNNTAYILECSSHEDAFDDWKQMFLSIAGSVDFRKARHELRSGNYFNFMADKRIEFKGEKGHFRTIY